MNKFMLSYGNELNRSHLRIQVTLKAMIMQLELVISIHVVSFDHVRWICIKEFMKNFGFSFFNLHFILYKYHSPYYNHIF